MSNKIEDSMSIVGTMHWLLTHADGSIEEGEANNLVTQIGDQMYGERGAGITATAAPTGMKLGSGSTAPAKTGAGAALETYIANSHQAFNSTPTSSLVSNKRRITYVTTWPAGKGTSASPITEVVIVNNALTDATSDAANTISRILLSPSIPQKGELDTLQITWLHDLGA